MMIRSCVSRHVLPLVLGIGLLLIGTACDQVPTEEPTEEKDREVTTQEVPEDEARSAREFWTEERMEAAKPYNPGWDPQEGDSPPPTSEPDIPGTNLETERKAGSPPELTGDDLENNKGFGPAPKRDTTVYDASKVNTSYTRYPFRTVGKVFFVKEGNWFSCSAAVIAAKNSRTVWTAGHCVSEKGNRDWHERWIFVPAYNNGNAPLGKWSARVKATLGAWHIRGNRNFDLGAVKVEKRNGQSIARVTGSLGWLFNGSRNQDWRELGYPASGNLFGGGSMWQCFAPYKGADGVKSRPGPRTSAIDCDMTGGASGGPWVVAFENCPQCYINSATSWGWWRRGHSNISTQLAGPYHGSGAFTLYKVAGSL